MFAASLENFDPALLLSCPLPLISVSGFLSDVVSSLPAALASPPSLRIALQRWVHVALIPLPAADHDAQAIVDCGL
jgi:hypothetical protein